MGYYDYRGSTVAITDDSGSVTDTFEYDSYGKLINRTGESFVIFGYNGRDGNTMVNSIVNKALFDENEKNYSRK